METFKWVDERATVQEPFDEVTRVREPDRRVDAEEGIDASCVTAAVAQPRQVILLHGEGAARTGRLRTPIVALITTEERRRRGELISENRADRRLRVDRHVTIARGWRWRT